MTHAVRVLSRLRSIAMAALLVASLPGHATIQRTFVATSGVDANPCTLTLPCRSVAAAIAQTNPGGEVIVLDSAGYGKATITQSVSLVAPSGIYAGVSVFAGDTGVTINAPDATVLLRGLTINGQGGNYGVEIQAAARVRIESCVISGMLSNGVNHHASGAELVMLDTIVRDNGGTGIGMAADAVIVLERVRSEHNAYDGLYVAPATTKATATVVESLFVTNGSNGIRADSAAGATTVVQVERSTMAGNAGAGFFTDPTAVGEVVHAMLERNAVNGNAGSGIVISASGSDTVEAGVFDNTVHGNGAVGLDVLGIGTVSVNASFNRMDNNNLFGIRCMATTYHALALYGNNVTNTALMDPSCYTTKTPL